MREILFRGKRIDNGEWVFGNKIFLRGRIINTDWDSICKTMIKPLTRPPISWQYISE